MGVIAFFSAKGSPGTTTTALLAAALWPAPVLLVDADTEGGDVALRLRREDGAPVDRSRGLLSLLPLARREMHPATLPEHAQVLRGGLEAVAGLSAPGQAGAAGHLWTNLADAFARTTDRDVLVDCGRVTSTSVHLPLLQSADLVVCVLRPDVSGVVHARDRLASLQPHLVGPDGHAPRVGLVVVAERPRGRDAEGAAGVLTRDLPGIQVFGRLAHDPQGAGVFEGFEVPRPERTLLVRSGREMVDELVEVLRYERRGEGPAVVPAPEPAEAAPAAGHRVAPRRSLRGRRARTGAA
jgi:MinD-like ATPase involved in chromosome partitioning or flagellar assembly